MISRSDIYFAADDAHTFLPWLIGVMIFLAALLLCLGVTINGWVVGHNGNYANSFTVNVPANTQNLDEKLTKINETLIQTPGVKDIRRVNDEALKAMLKPWLGDSDIYSSLPLPTVLEVTVESGGIEHMQYDVIERSVSAIAPGTEVDAHERWVAAFASFSTAVQSLIVILAVLIIGGIAAMISFTSRAALKLHSRTVHLLHSIGAEDHYITRQFQQEAFLLVLKGALTGCAVAGIAYWAGGLYIASLGASIMPSLAMGSAHVFLLIAMPIICALVACWVARTSVIRQLERSL